MNDVLSGLQGVELLIYLYDVIIHASSLRERSIKMQKHLGRLKTAGLTLEPDKCDFLKNKVLYLVHQVSDKGIKPDPKKVEAVQKFPTPTTTKKN